MGNLSKDSYFVGDKYKPLMKIGSGAFGDTFSAVCVESGAHVALKMESSKARSQQLRHEYMVYKTLKGAVGVPRAYWYGTEHDYNFLVMDLLGPSLEDLFNFCSRRFTMKTILMLADQMVGRIEYVHAKDYIHRDIKPDNFLMGRGVNCNTCFLVDFGLTKKYRDPSGTQIPFCDDKVLVGTARYASINSHLGRELSRRDDLESLAYVLLYFARGILPWQGLTAATKKQKYGKMCEKKMSTSSASLCQGLPAEFGTFLDYARGLRYDEEPNYMFIRQLFRILFAALDLKLDYMFDWCMFEDKLGVMLHQEVVQVKPKKSLPARDFPVMRGFRA